MRVSILLEALTARFVTDTSRASKHFQREMRDMERASGRVGAGIGLALGGAIIGAVAIVRSQAKVIDAMNDSARVVGLNIEALQELRFVGERFGISNTALERSVQSMQRRLGEYANSGAGPAAKAIELLGLKVTDTEGRMKSSEQLFIDVVDKLQNVGSDAQKAALAAQIFGNDFGPKLVPMLKQGTDGIEAMRQEIRDMGVVITQFEAESVARMNDKLEDAGKIVRSLGQRFTAELSPGIILVAEKFIGAGKESGAWADEAQSAAERVIRAMAFVADGVAGVGRAFEVGANAGIILFEELRRQGITAAALTNQLFLGGLFNDALQQDFRESVAITTEARAKIDEILKRPLPSTNLDAELARIRREIAAAVEDTTASQSSGGGLVTVVDPEEEKRIERLKAAMNDLISDFNTFGFDDEKALLKLIDLGATEEQLALARHVLDELRLLEEQEERIKQRGQERNALQREYAALVQSVQTPSEAHNEQLRRTTELYLAGIIPSAEEYEAILLRLEEAYQKGIKKQDEMSQFAIQAARNIQTALADFFFDPFDEGLEGMVMGFSNAIRRMAAEALAAQLLQKLFGTGESGDSTGGLVAFFANAFGGARQHGGPVSAGRPYLVGERGPEIVVPSVSGTVIPNNRIDAGGNISNTFIIPPEPRRRSERALAYEISQRQRVAWARDR